MSIHLYLKQGITEIDLKTVYGKEIETVYGKNGQKSYLWPNTANFENLENLDPQFIERWVEYITVEQTFWKSYGVNFAPGTYEGSGFSAKITPEIKSFRGGSDHILDYKQEIFARFETLSAAITFWKILCDGKLLPTKPLCRKLTLTEEVYARQASCTVLLSVQVGELAARVEQLMNQVQAQSQWIQDHTLTS